MAIKETQKTVGTALAAILCSGAVLATGFAPAASGSVSQRASRSAPFSSARPLAKRSGASSAKIGLKPNMVKGTPAQMPCRPLHVSAFGSFGPAFSHSVAQAIAQASANCPDHTAVSLQNTAVKLQADQSYQNLLRSDQQKLARLQQTKGIGVGLILGMENFLIIHETSVSS